MARLETATAEPRWFAWWDVQEALAYGRLPGIALHHFRYDLRRFGLGRNDPACHILSADRPALLAFGAAFDLRPAWLEPPRRHRPGIWHFDLFGPLLARLLVAYPLPAVISREDALAASGAKTTNALRWPGQPSSGNLERDS